MGAWIEIPIQSPLYKKQSVAPYMGAWIEILVVYLLQYRSPSLPTWERGLKLKEAQKWIRKS